MRTARPASLFPFFDNGGLPLAFAHRGGAPAGAEAGLENSMVAFQAAVDLGYRYVETDVHATRDGQLVAFHDATLERLTDGFGRLADLGSVELERIRIGGREPIPHFAELLSTWPELRINVDCKSAAAVPLLIETIAQHGAWDRVCVASFNLLHLRQVRRLAGPSVATAHSVIGVGALRFLPTARLRSVLLGSVGQAVQVPVRRGPIEVVTPDFIERAHNLGKQVHVWTIDAPEEISRLLDLGVDAVIADRIDVLRDVYLARGVWRDAVHER